MEMTFTSPDGVPSPLPDRDALREAVTHPGSKYWDSGSGDATLSFTENDRTVTLMVLPHRQHGVYLKYVVRQGRRIAGEWMALHDPQKLSEVTEVSDQWMASVGLFLPPETAWTVVEDFLATGSRSEHVAWVTPEEMPPDSNW